jgi:hypothetical protein
VDHNTVLQILANLAVSLPKLQEHTKKTAIAALTMNVRRIIAIWGITLVNRAVFQLTLMALISMVAIASIMMNAYQAIAYQIHASQIVLSHLQAVI